MLIIKGDKVQLQASLSHQTCNHPAYISGLLRSSAVEQNWRTAVEVIFLQADTVIWLFPLWRLFPKKQIVIWILKTIQIKSKTPSIDPSRLSDFIDAYIFETGWDLGKHVEYFRN